MTKHTPGPWQFQNETGCIVTEGCVPVAFVNGALPNRSDNGKLIAQVPRLLAALKDMTAGWRYIRRHHGDLYGVGWDRCEIEARAAIAAAEGEG